MEITEREIVLRKKDFETGTDAITKHVTELDFITLKTAPESIKVNGRSNHVMVAYKHYLYVHGGQTHKDALVRKGFRTCCGNID